MKISVAFLPADSSGDLSDTVCVVLDIFRATTSIVTAMANGCEAIIPVLSAAEAQNLAQQDGAYLLAGERQSIKLDGFDLGNSPFEFSGDKVKGRQIIMTTTNGTAAVKATEGACRTLIGSFLNAEAVCAQAKQYGKDILIVCAGTDGLFSLEDALCAGYMVELLAQAGHAEPMLTDAACGALLMYTQAKDAPVNIAKTGRNGRRLCDLGREDDIEYCFQINICDMVPEYRNGMIAIPNITIPNIT